MFQQTVLRYADPFRSARILLPLLCLIANFVTSGLTSNHYYTTLSDSDATASFAFPVAVGVFLAVLGFLIGLQALIVNILPFRPIYERKKYALAAISAFTLLASFSSWTSVVALGGGIAQSLHQREFVSKTQNAHEQTLLAIDAVHEGEAIVETGHEEAEDAKKRELVGSICGVGSGRGECYAILSAVSKNAEVSLERLSDAGHDMARLERKAESLVAELERVNNNADLSKSQRSRELYKTAKELRAISIIMRKSVAANILENSIESFSRPWGSLGISRIGARRMSEKFDKFAIQLEEQVESIEAAFAVEFPSAETVSREEALGIHFGQVMLPVFGIALFDWIPYAITLLLFAMAPYHPADDGYFEKISNEMGRLGVGEDRYRPQSPSPRIAREKPKPKIAQKPQRSSQARKSNLSEETLQDLEKFLRKHGDDFDLVDFD